MLQIARSKIQSLFTSGSASSPGNSSVSPVPIPPSFPRFSELPIELRLKIWKLSLSPRIIPMHLHQYAGNGQDAILDEEDGEEDDEEDAEEEDEEFAQEARLYNHLMCITICSEAHPCGCRFLPPRSTNTIPLPPVLLACRESREATMNSYSILLSKVYNHRGQAVLPPSSFTTFNRHQPDVSPYDASKTGISINPTLDIPFLEFNVAFSNSITDMNHFATIAAKEMSHLHTVVINLTIALPPYMWWQRSRFEKWRGWGATGYWIPKSVVDFRNLREVVLLVKEKTLGDMLPLEWRERTVSIWEMELRGMRSRWPEEWGGEMPGLRFVTSGDEIPGRAS